MKEDEDDEDDEDEDDKDDEDEDDNVGTEFAVVVCNRQSPITGTVPKKNSIRYRRIQGTERVQCRLMLCVTNFMHLF